MLLFRKRMIMVTVLSLLSLLLPVVARSARLTFWTTEVESDRMEVQREIAREFQRASGHRVSVVPVEESRLSQKVTAARAAGQLPDVIFVPASYANGWASLGILDGEAATRVVRDLGTGTFHGLRLLRWNRGYSAVPSDGWATLTLFRRDLYRQHNLPPPTSWNRLLHAGRRLHDPPYRFGALVPTHPRSTYTQQVFEELALSNGVRLIDAEGRVALRTPAMVETLKFYKRLARLTPPGNYYWHQTRLFYLVGRTATIFWSPFILDELTGARQELEVGVEDLPDRTGVRSVISGPRDRAAYVSINSFGITSDARTQAARSFVKHMLGEGYVSFISMDPFGKIPLRRGTPDQPDLFIDRWRHASPYLESYPSRVIDRMLEGLEVGDRWGLEAGYGNLVAKLYGTHVLPTILVRDYLRGSLTARQTAARMQQRVDEIRRRVEDPSSPVP